MELSLKQCRNIYFEHRTLMTNYIVYDKFMHIFKIDKKFVCCLLPENTGCILTLIFIAVI